MHEPFEIGKSKLNTTGITFASDSIKEKQGNFWTIDDSFLNVGVSK